MKRDMDLVRKILFKIEEEVDNKPKFDLTIDEYTMDQVAYHCSILYDGGYIKNYKSLGCGEGLVSFGVSGLTWSGHELLDKISNENVWNKTKQVVKNKGLPMVVDVIKDIATAIITSMTQAAIQEFTK
ncbi:MAG: DUF2513 domain-containing protein [Anaerocolumna aminovalerica]|uniref:DUF2513 domain-containing protein n=1 Tax=Anaerocolumna aminovalerica TaxID=1527 RepID=UPI00290C4ED1|nr:DUF2513 domain-containing protein [Anaerocolumna aminovalerica]MDU6263730.1 DUF2513 domain-containing protein [Anaerocolumna aminovalerica]